MATTWNSADKAAGITLSNGNLTATNTISNWQAVRGTQSLSMGSKGYFELVAAGISNQTSWMGGVYCRSPNLNDASPVGSLYGWMFQAAAYKRWNGTYPVYGVTLSSNDVLCVAVDSSLGYLWFGKNGTWMASGNPANGTNPSFTDVGIRLMPAFAAQGNNYAATGRFASASMGYSIPSGFSAWDNVSAAYSQDAGQAETVMLLRDQQDGGVLRVTELVTRLSSVPPETRCVRLCDQISGRLVRQQWSDPETGEVDFQYLREGPWVLYALDHTGEHEAVAISDRLATADGSRP